MGGWGGWGVGVVVYTVDIGGCVDEVRCGCKMNELIVPVMNGGEGERIYRGTNS